jgi:hypothetical protein
MKFKGDIIITDPCYIIREDKDYKDMVNKPKFEDYMTNKTYAENPELWETEMEKLNEAEKKWRRENPDHWDECDYGQDMEVLGIKTYLTSDTEYGDWSCTTYNEDGEKLGEFCADAGLVSVFLLDEVLKYNPEFDDHIAKPWTTTLIKDFDGEVSIEHKEFSKEEKDSMAEEDEEVEDSDWPSRYVTVVGKGNINFYTKQTGY